MRKNLIRSLLIVFLSIILILMFSNKAFGAGGADIDAAIGAMKGMSNGSLEDSTDGQKLTKILNSVIGLIQVAGTGISMVMVTMLGIKYMLAAPSDKADVKKQIAPLVIGAIILFASVNLVGIVADITEKTLGS